MSQESIPSNYQYAPSQPQIIITDTADVELYRYESKGLWPAGTQDFTVQGIDLHYGINDDHGTLGINISDDNAALTETDETQDCIIPRYSNIQLNLGKTLGGLNRWFYGKIMKTGVFRPNSEEQEIDLYRKGHIQQVPSHYRYISEMSHLPLSWCENPLRLN